MKSYIEIIHNSGAVRIMSHNEYSEFTYSHPSMPDISEVKVVVELPIETYKYVIYKSD